MGHDARGLLWGSQRTFADGSTRLADANYILQSMLEPQAQVVEGSWTVAMPVYASRRSRTEAITAYIRSLAEPEPPEGSAAAGGPPEPAQADSSR